MNRFATLLNSYFAIERNGSSIKQECIGGLTTFMAMAYVIFLVPSMLHDAGLPKEAAFTATIVVTALSTLAMGLFANFPVALAPGIGITAFFAYYVCGTMGLAWQTGLGAVFISGIVFLFLTVTRLRQLIIDSVPMDLKYAIVVGIGMFIAFIGLRNCGLIVADAATLVALGNLTDLKVLLAASGVCIIAGLMARKVSGAHGYGSRHAGRRNACPHIPYKRRRIRFPRHSPRTSATGYYGSRTLRPLHHHFFPDHG